MHGLPCAQQNWPVTWDLEAAVSLSRWLGWRIDLKAVLCDRRRTRRYGPSTGSCSLIPLKVRRGHVSEEVTRTYLKIVDVLKGGSQNCGHAAAER